MRGLASPAFTARIADIELSSRRKKDPGTLQSCLDIRLFLPVAASPVDDDREEYEYVLEHVRTGRYVHFLIRGVQISTTKQLHRLCLLLLHVRDTLYDGLVSFTITEN